MDDLWGCLFGLAAVIGIIYVIVVYVIPLLIAAATAILGGAAVIGAIIGLYKAISNFIAAGKTVRYRRQILRGYKNEYAAIKNIEDGADYDEYLKNYVNNYFAELGGDYKDRTEYKKIPENYSYEDIASRSYFFGPCFDDVLDTIRRAFLLNFQSSPDFSRGEVWYTKILYVVLSLFQVITTYVLGVIFTIILSAILLLLFLVFEIIFVFITGIALFFENMFYLSKKISFRCPTCKEEYKIPIYTCPDPECGIKHRRLRPGFYGILKRKCVCGCKIPLTARASGKYWTGLSVSTGNWNKFKFADLKSSCPHCGAEHNAKLSKPTSIALIGGASAGKTTFKVAFTYSFLDEELTKMNIDFGFPDRQSEVAYNNSVRYFKGYDIIPATNRGINTDIDTFSFFMEHKKFDTSRMIHIYDMPGEVFESGDAAEGWRNYRFTEGMVFLIDPFSLPEVKELHGSEIKGMGICQMEMNSLIESLVSTLQNERVKKVKGRFRIPVALTINKVDSPLLRKMCGTEAVQALMEGEPEIFDDYFTATDYICRCFLARNGGMGFIANLDRNFEIVHFFFSSPMGYIPQSTRTRFSPVNVLPMMQWMMLRADSQLARVWKPETPVIDVPEEKRELYLTHPEYYENYVLPLLEGVYST